MLIWEKILYGLQKRWNTCGDEDHMLGTGIVNYIFETDTNSCVISYSCAQQHFYQVRYFTKDELDSYLADEKEQGAKRSLERVILDVK